MSLQNILFFGMVVLSFDKRVDSFSSLTIMKDEKNEIKLYTHRIE